MEFPTLQTQRLILREIKLQDASDIFTIFSDPEVVRFHDLEVFQRAEEAERLIHSLRSALRNRPASGGESHGKVQIRL
jgi:ribosomal-protein-alanine N-acetyltransferase